MWGRRVIECSFFSRKCLSLYDYQSKASRYKKGLTYLINRVTTNQKHKIDSQKPKRREHQHNTKENHQTTKGKTKRKEEIPRNSCKRSSLPRTKCHTRFPPDIDSSAPGAAGLQPQLFSSACKSNIIFSGYHDIKRVRRHCVKDQAKGKKFYARLLHAYLHMLGLYQLSAFLRENIRIYYSLTSCQAHLILSFFTPQGVHRNTPSSILWICLYLKSLRCISTLI